MNRLESVFRAMGGSDYKQEACLEKALSYLPPVVLLNMTDKQLAQYVHNVSEALRESWVSGTKARA